MKTYVITVLGLFSLIPASAAHAAAPNSVVALLGPAVGYLLSQSDMCEWSLTEKITQTYKDGFEAIGMTAAQQATAWEQASATQKRLAGIPEDAKARMKADTCTAATRTRVEHDLAH